MSETAAEAQKEARVKQLLLYAGFTNNAKGEKRVIYYNITAEELAAGEFAGRPEYPVDLEDFLNKRAAVYGVNKSQRNLMGSIGMVYEVDAATDGRAIYPGTAKYVGRWKQRDDILVLQAKSDAAMAQLDALAARDKANKFNEVKDALEPVRRAYQRLPYPHRPFFLAQLVDYMNRSGK